MGRRIGIALLWAVAGYVIGAFGGGFLINLLSSNTHDRSVEAAMTGAFVFGPLVAIAAFITGVVRSGAR
jgi:hypothetical protein